MFSNLPRIAPGTSLHAVLGEKIDHYSSTARSVPWTLLPSLGLHGLLVLALAYPTPRHPFVIAPNRSVQVELITQQQYEDAIKPPPKIAALPPAIVDTAKTANPTASPTDGMVSTDGMIKATKFFANRLLADPRNSEAKGTFSTLERTERVIQLCNIEGIEQLRRVQPGTAPDAIAPSAFQDVRVKGYVLTAPGAAYRAARKWYAVRFTCSVAPDLKRVTAFAFAVGDPIPKSLWEAHDLIAADEEE